MNPTIFIILGITGDLAMAKLLPALLSLYVNKQLPNHFSIVGLSRRAFSREEFRQFVRENIGIESGHFREEDIKHFLDHMCYEQGFFDSKDSYLNLAKRLKAIDDSWGQCSNKLFHLAVSPHYYEVILDHLAASGLTIPCSDDTGWTRVLVEKPFGNDVETAMKLDKKLGNLFEESQIFRIDHYLAKESVQNILTFRFANAIFEPLWNSDFIDKVHIKLHEKGSASERGHFYDNIGALKDVGQNHMLQMLGLVAMEQPSSFGAEVIRKERAKIISRLRPITAKNIEQFAVRGQYSDYVREPGVRVGSQTETYFRLETHVDTPRWKGVPFFLESGKAFAENRCQIDVYFKERPMPKGFVKGEGEPTMRQNVLTFRIQPDEGIKIRFWVKTPGWSLGTEPKVLRFKYSEFSSLAELPDAYERVLHDAIVGDQTLFTSTDEVLAAWKFITPIVNSWHVLPLNVYKKGTREV
jgi:glucose-6-phosphate 1-dehydrogenase